MSAGSDPLSLALKAEARRLGFALAGVTTPAPPEHFAVYEAWLAEGRQAGMNYLTTGRARALRREPALMLPDCRSVLVLGMRHPSPESLSPGPTSAGCGRVAAYAWGRDYHTVLPERMARLVAFIESWLELPVPHRLHTDTGPVLERELAQRAGLGWIGRNGCLISPRLGSYFLLAEIFLGIELEPDPPFAYDRCGTCQRCRQACPTGCIRPDRTLEAGDCISYLTIENKGAIPPGLRPKIGNWVFGCDICQRVCPWNRFAALAIGDPALDPLPGVPFPDLQADLGLSPQEFNQRFKDSPVQRARRRGYRRNLAVALGNLGTPGTRSTLQRASQDEDVLVSEHASWALDRLPED